ncbi:hypothetical protein F5Y15DRAFT_299246 [Xylariaceae sp. FL0016]|nr:hypothetical protein F5Y15DRAFT_299246 [Xylariaceae sp. FL0016]
MSSRNDIPSPLHIRKKSRTRSQRKSSSESINDGGPLKPLTILRKRPTKPDLRKENIACDPSILIPRISITPEVKTLGSGSSSVWVAIEIFGELSRPGISEQANGIVPASIKDGMNMLARQGDVDLLRYGYLYNIGVHISGAGQGQIVGVIDDDTYNTMCPGSSILVLAKVLLPDCQQPHQPITINPETETDSLIANLEYELGTSRAKYLEVRVCYCHSGFPSSSCSGEPDGVSRSKTRLETTVVGVIKRLNSTSAWLPPQDSTMSPLLRIMTTHWGPVHANEVFCSRIANMHHRNNRRKTVSGCVAPDYSTGNSYDSSARPTTPRHVPAAVGPPLRVPNRRTSLGHSSSPTPGPLTEKPSGDYYDPEVDPARRIWTEMRRTSSRAHPAFHIMDKAEGSPPATAATHAVSSLRPRPKTANLKAEQARQDIERRRASLRSAAVQNKRSIGMDSLKSLVPSMVDLRIDGSGGTWDMSEGMEMNKENRPSQMRSPTPGEKRKWDFQDQCGGSRKREGAGRWSLGGWW